MVTESWEAFFLGQVGAAAALGGLIFVAVSLNLTRILSLPSLPGRAIDALSLIIVILVISSAMLIPGQPSDVAGIEVLAVGLLVWAQATTRGFRALFDGDKANRVHQVEHLILLQVALLPYLVAGILFLAGNLTAFYWLAGGIIVSFVKAVLDAWVLLVEINR